MKNIIEGKYRGWRIDKTSGSPLSGYAFAINGSILKGGKHALLKLNNGR